MRPEPTSLRSAPPCTAGHGAARRSARAFRRALRTRPKAETAAPALVALPAYVGDVLRLASGPPPSQRGACSALCAAVERAVRAGSASTEAVGTVRLGSGETASVRVCGEGVRIDVTIVASLALAAELGPRVSSLLSRLAARGLRVRSLRIERRGHPKGRR
jgi:hypothetical protein